MAAETVNFVNRRIASGGRFVTKQAERSLSHRNLISGKAWAAAAICLAVFLFSLFFIPIRNDDPYITARYARNLAAGNGFVYNSGERVLGTTSPLLTLILAAAMIPLPAEFALRLVTAALFAICSAAFWIYGSRFGQPLAGIAAALIFPAVDWSFLLAGNETPLFTALLLFAL
ncbi:hypothetical protein HYR69_05970, partial [Candidatus Sumerlaeota bacterium]|nr:hypothetical protein [Candidatus Sumerlaeota bacterium]